MLITDPVVARRDTAFSPDMPSVAIIALLKLNRMVIGDASAGDPCNETLRCARDGDKMANFNVLLGQDAHHRKCSCPVVVSGCCMTPLIKGGRGTDAVLVATGDKPDAEAQPAINNPTKMNVYRCMARMINCFFHVVWKPKISTENGLFFRKPQKVQSELFSRIEMPKQKRSGDSTVLGSICVSYTPLPFQ